MEESGAKDAMLRELSAEVSLMSLGSRELSAAGLESISCKLLLEILLADPVLVLQKGGLNDVTKELIFEFESPPLARIDTGLRSPVSRGELLVSDSVTYGFQSLSDSPAAVSGYLA